MKKLHTAFAVRLLILAGALTIPAAVLLAQAGAMPGFQPNSDFVIELGGETLKNGEIYYSDRARGYLLIAPELPSPLLVSIPQRAVEKVYLMKVRRRDDGAVDLLADALLGRISAFQVEGTSVSFDVNGTSARLVPKPALVGERSSADLVGHSPSYANTAENYKPFTDDLGKLKAEGRDVRVRVFFGTWCPVCSRQVPKLMRLQDELAGSKVNIEYYGLPRPPWDRSEHPEIDQHEIEGVPTAVVFVDGKKVGLLSGDGFTRPETTLRRLLGS